MTAALFDDRLFADAVMARINLEPLPTAARALRTAITSRDTTLARGAVWTAWHLTTSKALVIQTSTRVRNAALLAILALLLAISTVLAGAGVTSVVRTIIDGPSPFHSLVEDNGAPDDQGGAVPPAFQEPSEEPTGTPGETPDHTPGVTPNNDGNRPTAGPDEDDPGDGSQGDENGGSGPSTGGDNSGGGDEDNSGSGGDNSGGDEDNSGSGGDSSGGDEDNSGSGGDSSGGGDEASPGPTDDPDAGDDGGHGGDQESPEPTDGGHGGDGAGDGGGDGDN